MKKATASRVLSFEKNAEYHFERGQKALDSGKYLEALVSLRTAIKKEPENTEYRVSLAEIYTEIGDYEESNFLLFSVKDKSFEADKLFGMGCNFFGMSDLDHAAECFDHYVKRFPDGDFEFEALDMLDMIEDEQQEDKLVLSGEATKEIYDRAEQGRELLDTGEYEQAIKLLSEIAVQYPKLLFARNNLALAYYCNGDSNRAIEITEEVIAEEPGNVHAQCNLVLFMTAKPKRERCRAMMEHLEKLCPNDSEEATKIALTYCELNEHERAYGVLKDILREKPYDARVLFLFAAAAANCGRLSESMSALLDVLKIEPQNTIAAYYKGIVQKAKEAGKSVAVSYSYRVPAHEARRRMLYLNRCLLKPGEALDRLWREDPHFELTLRWALGLGEDAVSRAVVEIISSFRDEKARELLRRCLVDRNLPDFIKNEIFLKLRESGDEGPFPAYLCGKYVEVNVGMIGGDQGLNESAQRIAERIAELAQTEEQREAVPVAMKLLECYMYALDQQPKLRSIDAWATALLSVTLEMTDRNAEAFMRETCEREKISKSAVMRCRKKLEELLSSLRQEAEHGTD